MSTQQYQVFRNVCPRNCYGTCSMRSYIQDGILRKVEGDPQHGYTQGRLCAKGYAYTEYVYSPQRLRYPLRQYPRGSGNWQRLSWEQAITIISEKILELNHRCGSNLAAAYNKYSGNFGFLHYAVEGMFNSLGTHTKPTGNPCLAAGADALAYDLGQVASPDPESMAESKLITIWGANPAWTAIHQLHFINLAREKGAKVIVIDPLFTPTAAKADLFIQIKPETDGMLALAVAKLLVDQNQYDRQFVIEHVEGWEPFRRYLEDCVSIAQASEVTGIKEEGILELASLYGSQKPCAFWIGFGLQRHQYGGQSVRAIDALVALTGNHGRSGGGLFYYHPMKNYFSLNLFNHSVPLESNVKTHRRIDINHFASEALALDNPPLKLLWVACRNPLSQDSELKLWGKLFQQLELVVTVDLFMTQTAMMSDIVLPATSHFEELDLHVSYWHRWVALNQKAIEPYYEAKSELEIARELTRKLNQLSPNFSNFPYELSATDWIGREFTPKVLDLLGLSHWQELFAGPRKLNFEAIPWQEKRFKTPTGKFELYAKTAKENNLPALPKFRWPKAESSYPLRLLTPQSLAQIHSQYRESTWLNGDPALTLLDINPVTAASKGIMEGDIVSVFNRVGAFSTRAHLNSSIPMDVVVTYQGGRHPANVIFSYQPVDMGCRNTGSNGLAFYDVYVDVKKLGGNTHD